MRRGRHEVRCRLGLFRSSPQCGLAGTHYAGPGIYCPSADFAALPEAAIARILARARRVVGGQYEAYGHEWRALPRTEVEWRTHPVTGYEFAVREWWKLDHMPSGADIKDVWEPGRFGWIYDLVRAFTVTRDAIYADAFHRLLASWEEANPPFRGVQWACGQETAIRGLAILHGMDSLPVPTDGGGAATDRMLRLLAWSGERIADAIGYALSQRNNHGIAEAAGLLHIGLRLRGMHPHAQHWIRAGRRFLETQIVDQFSKDGWYAQHSFTYMRVALEQAVLAQYVMQKHGMSLSHMALERLRQSFRLLASLIDARTGYVPNHGANDGGRAALWSSAPYRDFRPIATQAALILGLPLPADVGADVEVVCWLGGVAPATAPVRHDGVVRGDSGWAVARVGQTVVFLRAGRYRHRPSHMDVLHLDVVFDHSEVIGDPGTFAYNAPAPWNNALSSAMVHNGPVLDSAEPGERGPRFLWYSWPVARLLEANQHDGAVRLVAEVPHRVRRVVEVTARELRVGDVVLDPLVQTLQVNWLLIPQLVPSVQVLVEDAEIERTAAVEGNVVGWFSPSYGLRVPATTVKVRRVRRGQALQLDTVIRPSP